MSGPFCDNERCFLHAYEVLGGQTMLCLVEYKALPFSQEAKGPPQYEHKEFMRRLVQDGFGNKINLCESCYEVIKMLLG